MAKLGETPTFADVDRIATDLMKQGAWADCITEMLRARSLTSDPAAVELTKTTHARCLLELDRSDESIQVLSTIQREGVDFDELLCSDVLLAQAYHALGDLPEALRILKQYENDPRSTPSIGLCRGLLFFWLGLLTFQMGDKAAGVPYMERGWIGIEDHNIRDSAVLYLAYCYRSLHNFDKALASAQHVLTHGSGSEDVNANFELGLAYMGMENFKEARVALMKAASLPNNGSRAYSDIETALQELDRRAHAIKPKVN